MFFFKKKEIPLNHFFSNGFVDIHSHLLPGIDDGAKDLNNSIELIQKMSSYGIKNFITTPHVLGDVYPNSSETIKNKLKEVRDELNNRNIKDVTINAAAEYMMDEQFSDLLEKGDILTLKDNYILVEMSYFSPPINLFEILFQIQLKGYKPILAHPERYNSYHNNFEVYYKTATSDENLNDIGYIQVSETSNNPADENTSVFRQYEYLAGGQGGNLNSFTQFQVKIVMTSSNTSKPPKIKDLRTIALVT